MKNTYKRYIQVISTNGNVILLADHLLHSATVIIEYLMETSRKHHHSTKMSLCGCTGGMSWNSEPFGVANRYQCLKMTLKT